MERIKPEFKYVTKRDLDELVRIENECFPEFPWSKEEFRQVLDKDRHFYGVIARLFGQPVGFVTYRLLSKVVLMVEVAVAPEWQRMGYGAMLVDRLRDKLSTTKRSTIITDVRESNLGAQLFLRHLGFRCVKIVGGRYIDCDEDAYCFEYRFIAPKNRVAKYLGKAS